MPTDYEEAMAEKLRELLKERTQLVDMDADDLAWDILHLLKDEGVV